MRVREKQDKVQVEEAETSAPRYVIRTLEVQDWPIWDAFVSQSPQGTLFHATKWLQTTGTPFRIYGCYHQDSLVGGMVVEIVAPQVADHSYFISDKETEANGIPARQAAGHSPNCPYLGVVLPPPSGKYLTTLTEHRNILTWLAGHLKEQFVSIKCTMGPDVTDMQPFMWAGYSISLRYTYRIDLRDLDVVWRNMTYRRRNDIRKAERDGITIDDQGSMKDILSLVEGTIRRQRYTTAHFSELADRREQMLRTENQCRYFIARNPSGEAVAGIYMVWDEKCAYYLMGGYGIASIHRGAGALAIWEAIRYAGKTLGLRQFDIMASSIPSIERFMRDFGGSLTPVFIVSWQRPQRPSFLRDLLRVMRELKASFLRDLHRVKRRLKAIITR